MARRISNVLNSSAARRLNRIQTHIGLLKISDTHPSAPTKTKISFSDCSSAPRISFSANKVLVDEKVGITVDGLGQKQKITLQVFLKEADKTYGACGHYVANQNGQVETFRDTSHGGTFEGVELMGLFWSMKVTPGVKPGRLVKADVTTPFQVTVAVQDGFRDFEELPWCENVPCLAAAIVERSYMAPGVVRIPVNENGIHGTLFLPPGKGPFPAFLDFFGLTGGIIEFRSALLASKGFASFVIAYVNHEDLPKDYLDLDLHYFLKAFDWLSARPEVDPEAIGGIATCSGGGYMYYVGFMRPSMKCIVTINGNGCPVAQPQVIEGEEAPVGMFDTSRFKWIDGNLMSFKDCFLPGDRPVLTEAWRHGAKLMVIHGLDDQCVNPLFSGYLQSQIPPQFQSNCEFHYFHGAGHLLEPPHKPLCRQNYNKIFKVNFIWGGQPRWHAKAEEESWPKIIQFLRQHLKREPSDNNLQMASL